MIGWILWLLLLTLLVLGVIINGPLAPDYNALSSVRAAHSQMTLRPQLTIKGKQKLILTTYTEELNRMPRKKTGRATHSDLLHWRAATECQGEKQEVQLIVTSYTGEQPQNAKGKKQEEQLIVTSYTEEVNRMPRGKTGSATHSDLLHWRAQQNAKGKNRKSNS